MHTRIRVFTLIFFLTGYLLLPAFSFASDTTAIAQVSSEKISAHEDEGFNLAAFIMDHVTDKYEWHVWGPHEGGFSVPLPVILYTKENSLNVFLSSKFENGESYKGYTLNHEGHIERADKASFYDFSITKTVAEILIAALLMLWMGISAARAYTRRKGLAPKGFQNAMEILILFVRDDLGKTAIGGKHYKRFTPFLLTVFFFIFISNFLGLIPVFPFGANITGNISVSLALALIVLVLTLFIGNKHYWEHIVWMPGVPAWVKIFLLTPIEILGVVQRPAILMIRLFANIVAGHIVILSFVCLIFVFGAGSDAGGWGFSPVSMAFAIFMNCMELLVAFLQAYVFTLLTAMYIGSCVEEPHHAEHH
ncbi:MAG: ATP synthase F0 subunit A [Bacteroidetes bacterium]|nr:MAG: ATP synthase F0 subunit A [Bacteroidota bacterium]